MNKQNKFVIYILAGLTFFAWSSCNKDEDPDIHKPLVETLEVGHDNNRTAYPGSDLHLDVVIVAPRGIAHINLEIHPESGEGWTFEKVFTEDYEGLRNASFHEHVDVPADALEGEYHLHLTVTDKVGNTAEAESYLEIKVDPTLPSVTGFEVVYDAEDDDLHVEADITASNNIAQITIEIHGGGVEKEYEVGGDYVGQTAFHLHQHFDLTDIPDGHYHVHLKVIDQVGKESEFEDHFNK